MEDKHATHSLECFSGEVEGNVKDTCVALGTRPLLNQDDQGDQQYFANEITY